MSDPVVTEWQTDMVGWLIEVSQSDGAEFWTGRLDSHTPQRWDEDLWLSYFTKDANKAVRFRTEDDALAVIRLFPAAWDIRAYAADHIWLRPMEHTEATK